MSHMTRDEGWRFLGLGRLVERLLFVIATLSEAQASPGREEPALLEWLLDLFDKTVTYRARYLRPPEWLAVMDLLLFDRKNPRSAAFQLDKLGKQTRLLDEADFEELAARFEAAAESCRGAEGQGRLLSDPAALQAFLGSAERLGRGLSDALTLRYFSHVYETAATPVV
jgi:uncharacterized alpha-E superfamily protein